MSENFQVFVWYIFYHNFHDNQQPVWNISAISFCTLDSPFLLVLFVSVSFVLIKYFSIIPFFSSDKCGISISNLMIFTLDILTFTINWLKSKINEYFYYPSHHTRIFEYITLTPFVPYFVSHLVILSLADVFILFCTISVLLSFLQSFFWNILLLSKVHPSEFTAALLAHPLYFVSLKMSSFCFHSSRVFLLIAKFQVDSRWKKS